jgi:hypothetical protein
MTRRGSKKIVIVIVTCSSKCIGRAIVLAFVTSTGYEGKVLTVWEDRKAQGGYVRTDFDLK